MAILLIQGECTAHTTAGNAFGANDIRANVDTTDGFTTPANRQGQYAQGDTAVSYYPVEAAPNAAGVFWFHARVEADTVNTANFQFNDPNTPDLEIIVGGADNRIQIETTTTVVSQTNRTPATTFDVDVELATASGNWKVYINNVEVASGTGNATVQALDLTTLTQIFVGGGASFSEMVVTQDESTIGARVVVLTPDGEGSSTDMTGDINNINNNGLTADGYTIEGAGSQTFSYSNMPAEFANDFVIKAVSVDTVASAADAATAKEMTPIVDGNPLDPEILGVNSNDSTVTRIMTTHPDTSEWTLAKLDALEVGVSFDSEAPGEYITDLTVGTGFNRYGHQGNVPYGSVNPNTTSWVFVNGDAAILGILEFSSSLPGVYTGQTPTIHFVGVTTPGTHSVVLDSGSTSQNAILTNTNNKDPDAYTFLQDRLGEVVKVYYSFD
ncbi:hypothetical protein [Vibrio phage VCPH]|nr:hypothetical protein [Vibrio phage VCPH]